MKKGLTLEETITFGNIIADIYAEEYFQPVELSDYEDMFMRIFGDLVDPPQLRWLEEWKSWFPQKAFSSVEQFVLLMIGAEHGDYWDRHSRLIGWAAEGELPYVDSRGFSIDGLFVGRCLRTPYEVNHERGLRWAIRKMQQPNWDLKKAWYRLYLDTDEWRNKRNEALRRDGFKCVRCSSIRSLQVHHLTYERIGVEAQEDLVTLCRPCHEAIEDVPSSLNSARGAE